MLTLQTLPSETALPTEQRCVNAQGFSLHAARLGWARLLKRVFDIDIEKCPQCGGTLTILAAIEDPSIIVKI